MFHQLQRRRKKSQIHKKLTRKPTKTSLNNNRRRKRLKERRKSLILNLLRSARSTFKEIENFSTLIKSKQLLSVDVSKLHRSSISTR